MAEQSLSQQYDLEEATPEPTEPAPGLTQAVSTAPPRDPQTGRFVSSPEPASEPPAHSPAILQMALDFGLSDAEVGRYSPEQLATTVHALQRQLLAHKRDASIERTVDQARTPAPQAAPEPEPEPDVDLGVDLSDFDPSIQKAIKAAALINRKEIDALKEEVKQLRQAEVGRQVESLEQMVDRKFTEQKDYFGEGRGREVQKKDQAAFERRRACLMLADADKSNLPYEEKVEKAIKVLRGVPSQTAPTPPAVQPSTPPVDQARLDQWREGALAKPTQRQPAAEPNGVQKATKSVAAALKEMGSPNTETTPDDFPE